MVVLSFIDYLMSTVALDQCGGTFFVDYLMSTAALDQCGGTSLCASCSFQSLYGSSLACRVSGSSWAISCLCLALTKGRGEDPSSAV